MELTAFKKFCTDNGLKFSEKEPMSRHTSFKTGGNADLFLEVNKNSELSSILKKAKELSVPLTVIGKGTNLLVSDNGIEGAVLSLCGLDGVSIDGEYITAGAGAPLTAVCIAAAKAGLSGLEFAYGIPGTVGGALYMNAGAYGGEMSDVVVSAKVITAGGDIKTVSAGEMGLGYRTSAFKGGGFIITEVTFKLEKGDPDSINAKMQELMARRKEKQPLEYPSAGSTFKRPKGNFAGTLIEKSGLKGVKIGGAAVSEKHAGFVINKGGATTGDILALIEKIKETVLSDSGVLLETEVIFVGRKQ